MNKTSAYIACLFTVFYFIVPIQAEDISPLLTAPNASTGTVLQTQEIQFVPASISDTATPEGLTAVAEGVLSDEQMKTIIKKTHPNMIFDNAVNSTESNLNYEYFVRSKCYKMRIVPGNSEQIIVNYRSYGSCRFCRNNSIILVDEQLNTLSVFSTGSTNLDDEFEFVDLKCDGANQFFQISHLSGAATSGADDARVYACGPDMQFKEIFYQTISTFEPGEGYDGEKTNCKGTLEFGKCRTGTYKDIIVKKEYSHFDEFYSKEDNAWKKEYLEKNWVVNESYRFNGDKYVLYKVSGRDPTHMNRIEKFFDNIFHKKKKSKLMPGSSMRG